jgi:hypothetical protein
MEQGEIWWARLEGDAGNRPVVILTQLPQFASQNALGDSAMGDFSQKSSLQSNHLQAAWQSQAQFVE